MWTCAYAAHGGHIDILQWLRAQTPPCPWEASAYSLAARGGHLDVMQWLRVQTPPCPWSEDVCVDAAARGHLDALMWLRAQKPPCPWGERTCTHAMGGGHHKVLQWLRAQKPPCPCTPSVLLDYLEVRTFGKRYRTIASVRRCVILEAQLELRPPKHGQEVTARILRIEACVSKMGE